MKSLTPKIIKTQSQHQINAFRVPLNARNACVCVCACGCIFFFFWVMGKVGGTEGLRQEEEQTVRGSL